MMTDTITTIATATATSAPPAANTTGTDNAATAAVAAATAAVAIPVLFTVVNATSEAAALRWAVRRLAGRHRSFAGLGSGLRVDGPAGMSTRVFLLAVQKLTI